MNWLKEKALDLIWDWTPSGDCPVCAFWRGAAAGAVVVGALAWIF